MGTIILVVPAKTGTHSPRIPLLKQSRRPVFSNNIRRGVWVPAFAGTTWGESMRSRSRGMVCPSFSNSSSSPSKQRAQGKPGADCTRGLVCQTHSCGRTRAYRFSRNSPAFPTQWVYGLLRALPGERACLSPSPCGKLPARLSASIAAPGPHDFAVRLGVFVRREKHA